MLRAHFVTWFGRQARSEQRDINGRRRPRLAIRGLTASSVLKRLEKVGIPGFCGIPRQITVRCLLKKHPNGSFLARRGICCSPNASKFDSLPQRDHAISLSHTLIQQALRPAFSILSFSSESSDRGAHRCEGVERHLEVLLKFKLSQDSPCTERCPSVSASLAITATVSSLSRRIRPPRRGRARLFVAFRPLRQRPADR